MQTIKNLYQVKGGSTATTTDSQDVQAEILRLFEEDKATYLLLYGDNSNNDNSLVEGTNETVIV